MTMQRGATSAAGPGGSSAANGVEAGLPDTPDSLFFGAVAAELERAAQDAEEEEPEYEDLEDEVPGDESDEDDEPELGDAPGEDNDREEPGEHAQPPKDAVRQEKPTPKGRRSVEEWATFLATEGVSRVAEVPNAVLRDPKLLDAYAKEVSQRTAAATQAQIADQLQRQEQMRQFVAEVDQHFADDPDGKLDWIETDPRGQVYLQSKQYLAQIQGQTPQQRVEAAAAVQALSARSQRQYARLERWPELQQELVRRQSEEHRYPATEDGLAALERDVDELIERGYAGGSGAQTPAREGSQAPAAERRRPARPITGAGGAGRSSQRDSRDISQINDPHELFAMGVQDAARGRRG